LVRRRCRRSVFTSSQLTGTFEAGMSSYYNEGRDRGGYNGRAGDGGGRRGRGDAYESRDGGREDQRGSERRRPLSRSPRRSTRQPSARGGSDGPRRSGAQQQDVVSQEDPESGYSSGEDARSGEPAPRAVLKPKGSGQASASKAKAADSTRGDSSSQAKEAEHLSLSSCRDRTISAIVKGTYTLFSRNHDRPVYKKDEKSSVRQSSEMDVFIYFWDERDGPDLCGWWISPSVGGDEVWAYHSSRTALKPPPGGWNVPHDGETDSTFSITPSGKDEVVASSARQRRDRSTSVKKEVPKDTAQAPRSERRERGDRRADVQASKSPEVKPPAEPSSERREKGSVAADSQMSKYLQARGEKNEERPKERKEDTPTKSSELKPAESKHSLFAEIFEKRLADARRERRQRGAASAEEPKRAPEKQEEAEPKVEEKKVEEPKVEVKEKEEQKPKEDPDEKTAQKADDEGKAGEESEDYESYENEEEEEKEDRKKPTREDKRNREEEPAEDKRRRKDREEPRGEDRRPRRDRDEPRGEDERPRGAREDPRLKGDRRRHEDGRRGDVDDRRCRGEERRGNDRRGPDDRRRRDDDRPMRDNRRRHDDFLGDDQIRSRERRRDDDQRRPYDEPPGRRGERGGDFHRRRRDDDPRREDQRHRRRPDNEEEDNMRSRGDRGDRGSRRPRGDDDERDDNFRGREDRRGERRRRGDDEPPDSARTPRRDDRRDERRDDDAEPPRSREQRPRDRDERRPPEDDDEPLKRHPPKPAEEEKPKARSKTRSPRKEPERREKSMTRSPSSQRRRREQQKQDKREDRFSEKEERDTPKADVQDKGSPKRDEPRSKDDDKPQDKADEKARVEKEEDQKAKPTEEDLRKAKEEEMKKLEEELQRKRDEKRKIEDEKRKAEDEARFAQEAEKRKAEAEKRKAEEEEKKKKEEEDKKRQEEELLAIKQQESTLKVLAVLQKLASTTPSNFEALQKECDDILKAELENCGPQRELLEAEARQVVSYAKHYVNQELENKKKQQELKEQEGRVLQDLEDLVCAAEKAAEDVQALAVPFDQGEDLDADAVASTAVIVDRKGRAAMKACSKCADFITERKGMIEKAEQAQKEKGEESKLKAVLPRIRKATAVTATAFQHAKEKKEFIKTRRAKKWFSEKCSKMFAKYDKDGDGFLKNDEIAAYAKSEFGFDIPQESLDRIRSMLVSFGDVGISFEKFPLMRNAVGIARNEVIVKRRKVDRQSREEFVEEKRQALKKDLQKSVSVMREQDDNIKKVEVEAKALVSESAGMQPELFQQRLHNLIAVMAEIGKLMLSHKEIGQKISKEVKDLPELSSELNPGISEIFKRLADYENRLEQTGTVVSAARQMAVYVSLLEYERLWREVVVGLRVCLEQQARPIEELYDTIAVRGGDTISTVQIHAFLLDHHCALEKDKVDKVFGRWALTQQNALASALRKKAEAEAANQAKNKASAANEEGEEAEKVSKEDLLAMNVPVLKTMCKSRKLPDTGDKDELVNRLHASYTADSGGTGKADGGAKATPGGTGQEDLQMGTLLIDSTIRLTRAEFMSTIRMYYKVVRQCVLSDHLLIDQSKQLRHLQVGELIDVHRGPAIEPNVKIYRIQGRVIKDAMPGWSTIAGNQGITFLQLIGRVFKVRKEVALTGDLKDVEGAPLLRNLQEGEYIEVLEFAWTSRSALGVLRVQVRVEHDQSFGWVTVRSNDGTVYLEELMTETT